jgi:hypothetical protein
MKGHFKSLSQINPAPVPVVLSTDKPTQVEPSFMSENVSFGSRTLSRIARKNQLQKSVLLSSSPSSVEPVFYTALVSSAFNRVYFLS